MKGMNCCPMTYCFPEPCLFLFFLLFPFPLDLKRKKVTHSVQFLILLKIINFVSDQGSEQVRITIETLASSSKSKNAYLWHNIDSTSLMHITQCLVIMVNVFRTNHLSDFVCTLKRFLTLLVSILVVRETNFNWILATTVFIRFWWWRQGQTEICITYALQEYSKLRCQSQEIYFLAIVIIFCKKIFWMNEEGLFDECNHLLNHLTY